MFRGERLEGLPVLFRNSLMGVLFALDRGNFAAAHDIRGGGYGRISP